MQVVFGKSFQQHLCSLFGGIKIERAIAASDTFRDERLVAGRATAMRNVAWLLHVRNASASRKQTNLFIPSVFLGNFQKRLIMATTKRVDFFSLSRPASGVLRAG